jgi:hypothetical protein
MGWSRENGEAVTLRSAVAVQRRLLTTTSFVDNNQIVDGRGAVKLGLVLAHESLAPTSVPIPRQPPEVGAFICLHAPWLCFSSYQQGDERNKPTAASDI